MNIAEYSFGKSSESVVDLRVFLEKLNENTSLQISAQLYAACFYEWKRILTILSYCCRHALFVWVCGFACVLVTQFECCDFITTFILNLTLPLQNKQPHPPFPKFGQTFSNVFNAACQVLWMRERKNCHDIHQRASLLKFLQHHVWGKQTANLRSCLLDFRNKSSKLLEGPNSLTISNAKRGWGVQIVQKRIVQQEPLSMIWFSFVSSLRFRANHPHTNSIDLSCE